MSGLRYNQWYLYPNAGYVARLEAEVKRLREALEHIASPFDYDLLDRENMLEGVLIGRVEIAREALSPEGSPDTSQEDRNG